MATLDTKPSSQLNVRSFQDLASVPPEPDWVLQGVLASGALTLLAGHPYVGKTMLISALLKAMEHGEPFLGRATQPSTALVVTEEHEATLRPRADALGLLELKSQFVSRGDGVLRMEWPGLIETAGEYALHAGHRLLVIDTFAGLARLQPDEENDAGAVTERLSSLSAVAGDGLAVLVVHHTNKGGQIRGSSAFRGATDVTVLMRRDSGKSEFRLAIESRFSAPTTLRGGLVKSPDGPRYVETSHSGARRTGRSGVSTADERLRDAVRNSGAAGITYDEIAELPDLSLSMAKRRLGDWFEDQSDVITRTGSGVKGDPFRWMERQ